MTDTTSNTAGYGRPRFVPEGDIAGQFGPIIDDADTGEFPAVTDETVEAPYKVEQPSEPKLYKLPNLRLPTRGYRMKNKVDRWLASIDRTVEDPDYPGYALITDEDWAAMPEPTPKEAAQWDRDDFARLEDETLQQLRSAIKLTDGGIIAIARRIGGAGSTSVATNLVAILAQETNANVLLFDANYAEGCAAERLGFSRIGENQTLDQETLSKYKLVFWDNPSEFDKYAPRSYIHGASAIASSEIDDAEGRKYFFGIDIYDCIRIAKHHRTIVVVDMPNSCFDDIGLRIFDMADVVISTASEDKEESRLKMGKLLVGLRTHQHPEFLTDERGLVVFSGVPQGADIEAYRPYAENVFEKHNETDYDTVGETGYTGKILPFSFDPWVKANRTVDSRRLQPGPRQDIRAIALEAVRRLPIRAQMNQERMEQLARTRKEEEEMRERLVAAAADPSGVYAPTNRSQEAPGSGA